MPRWLAYSLVAFVIWGVWGLIPKATSPALQNAPMLLQVLSTLGLLPVALAFFLSRRIREGTNFGRGIAAAFVTGICASAGNLSFLQALNRGGEVSLVLPLSSLFPVVTVVLAVVFLKEKLNAVQGVGFAVALGAIVISNFLSAGDDVSAGKERALAALKDVLAPWMVYTFICLVCFALAAFFQKVSTNNISNELSTALFGIGFLPVALYILATEKLTWALSAKDWFYGLLFGVIIGVGGLALFASYRWGKASVVTAITGSYPALTVVLAVPLFRERLHALKIVAIVLALVAALMLTYEKKPEPEGAAR
jgi:uncharacterized membrane protein